MDGEALAGGDVKTGGNIARLALEKPMRGIAGQAGKDGAVVIEMVRQAWPVRLL